MVIHLILLKTSTTLAALSARTMQWKRISEQGSVKHTVLAVLQPIWKSRQCILRTKVRPYNSNVKSVLLFGSECLRVVKGDMNKINAFHNGSLRKICRIFLPERISNEELYRKTKSQSVVLKIKTALRWTPPGKRKKGYPKTTCW